MSSPPRKKRTLAYGPLSTTYYHEPKSQTAAHRDADWQGRAWSKPLARGREARQDLVLAKQNARLKMNPGEYAKFYDMYVLGDSSWKAEHAKRRARGMKKNPAFFSQSASPRRAKGGAAWSTTSPARTRRVAFSPSAKKHNGTSAAYRKSVSSLGLSPDTPYQRGMAGLAMKRKADRRRSTSRSTSTWRRR